MQGRMALWWGGAGLLALLSVPLPAVAERRAPEAATRELRPVAGAGLPGLPNRPAGAGVAVAANDQPEASGMATQEGAPSDGPAPEAGVGAALPTPAANPFAPVPAFDIGLYAGLWYDIAATPDRFHGECADDATTRYTPLPDAQLRVDNRCRLRDGSIRHFRGALRVKQPGSLASRLQVRYAPDWLAWMPLAWSEVWVIELDPAYGHAVVATPDREHLWILSRQPDMPPETYESLLARARALGFATERLRRIPQGGGAASAEGQSRR